MKARLQQLMMVVAIAAAICVSCAHAFSDDTTRDLDATGSPIRPAPIDPAIAHALQQISPQQIQHTIETLVGFHTRNTLSSMTKDLPAGQGASAAADWIESEFKRYSAACGGCLEVRRDTFTESPQSRIPQPTTITNVYAILRGSDPAQAKRMVLVTGHYDSRNSDTLDTHGEAPGANDDASGVAVSLECARVLSKIKFPATIVFVAVAGEEQGLNGSRHLAKLAKTEGWQLEAVLNNDIVGGNTTPGDTLQNKSLVRVFSESIPASATPDQAKLIQSLGYESDSPSRELARMILGVGETYHGIANVRKPGPPSYFHPVLEFRRDRFLRGGDHTSFNGEGFAAVRFTEWREDFNHQHQNVRTENGVEYGDELKYVDYQYVAHVVALNAATLATLAYAPPAPENAHIVTKNLDNNTTLEWTGSAAPSGTKYEVVWREMTAPTWQFFTSNGVDQLSTPAGGYSITLPISKDNVVFGIRSVDARGNRSPVVVPIPER
jgi:Peptidase family M28